MTFPLWIFFLNVVARRYTVGIQQQHAILPKYFLRGKIDNLDPISAKIMQPHFVTLTSV